MTHLLSRRRFLQLTGGAGAATLLDITTLLPTADHAGAQSAAVGFVRDATGITVVDVVYRPDESGYWVLCSDGSVFGIGIGEFGSAATDGVHPAVALASTPDGGGYWIFDSLGRVQAFGNATSMGDLSDLVLAGPIVDASALDDGTGYYMLGSDGGIFSFGSARFHGSVPQVLPGVQLNQPVVGLVPDGTTGYWLVAADGGLFSFGSAAFQGSVPEVLGTAPLAKPVVGALASGNAYLMVAADGGIFSFGSTQFHGSRPELQLDDPADVTCADVTADRSGYLMLDDTGIPAGFGTASTDAVRSTGRQARSTHRYNFMPWFDRQPLRWPSSDPIHYVTNNDFGPSGATQMIHDAVAEISALTGLAFIHDGATSEYVGHRFVSSNDVVLDERSAYQPQRYGERWAPVWIGARPGIPNTSLLGTALTTPHFLLRATEDIEIDENGQPTVITVGEPTYVTGHIGFVWGNGSRASLVDLPAVLLHELGHLVGLDHAGDIEELMFASLTDQTAFGSGDRLGLAMLGQASRHPTAPGPGVGIVLSNRSLAANQPIGGGCRHG